MWTGECVYSPGQTEHTSLKQPVSKLASILQGGLVDILITLNFLKTELNKRMVIKIFSDRQSAVGLLTLGWELKASKYFKNKDIDVQIEWTPGHANIPGNKIADTLAKEAAKEVEYMTEHDTVTTMTDIRKGARDYYMKKWKRKWEAA